MRPLVRYSITLVIASALFALSQVPFLYQHGHAQSRLREQLATLNKTKAELQDEESLISDIARTENEIANLHAARKIQDLEQSLRELIRDFPNSPAAVRARSMLRSLIMATRSR